MAVDHKGGLYYYSKYKENIKLLQGEKKGGGGGWGEIKQKCSHTYFQKAVCRDLHYSCVSFEKHCLQKVAGINYTENHFLSRFDQDS